MLLVAGDLGATRLPKGSQGRLLKMSTEVTHVLGRTFLHQENCSGVHSSGHLKALDSQHMAVLHHMHRAHLLRISPDGMSDIIIALFSAQNRLFRVGGQQKYMLRLV